MENECFICKQTLERTKGNVHDTPCCHHSTHMNCQQQWTRERFVCAYCREPLDALEPVPEKFLKRLRMTEWLLSEEEICYQTVTIVDAGSQVRDEDVMSALGGYLDKGHPTYIKKENCNCEGFMPARISSIKYTVLSGASFSVAEHCEGLSCNG